MIEQFMIDPPWPKRKGNPRKVAPNQTRELAYATMQVSDIFALLDREIFPQAAPMHNIWLWGVDQFLWDAEAAMRERGYRLHARMIWDKGNGVAPAFTIRYSHEYLLWFYTNLRPVAKDMRGKLRTVFHGAQREHSRKPDEAYHLVRLLYPTGPAMDVFSREKREGWAQWGNECEKFGTVAAGRDTWS